MANILAFAGSNSSTSINLKLVTYTASKIENHEIAILNLADLPLPMYSEDYEKENGFPKEMLLLVEDIKNADGLLIAVNEHNGYPSAYFKNVLDWMSRIERNFFLNKKLFLLATSPGKGGAKSALSVMKSTLPHFGAEISATFSLPSFQSNFSEQEGILDNELANAHATALNQFLKTL